MEGPKVAIVSCDPAVRMMAARACDRAPRTWRIDLFESPPAGADVIVAGPDVDLPGAVPFRPERPERLIDDVRASFASPARVVVVTGAGGGTGATTVAIHLAARLGRAAAVCYVDFDPDWGAAERLGLPAEYRSWGEIGAGGVDLDLAALPVAGGFRALVSRPERAGTGGKDMCTDPGELLGMVVERFEGVVVDARGGLLPPALDRASIAVLVMAPSPVSARRAREVIDAHPNAPWGVVVNRTGPGGEVLRSGLERIAGESVVLELPCTRGLRDAEDSADLLDRRWSRWSARIDRLAAAIEEQWTIA